MFFYVFICFVCVSECVCVATGNARCVVGRVVTRPSLPLQQRETRHLCVYDMDIDIYKIYRDILTPPPPHKKKKPEAPALSLFFFQALYDCLKMCLYSGEIVVQITGQRLSLAFLC